MWRSFLRPLWTAFKKGGVRFGYLFRCCEGKLLNRLIRVDSKAAPNRDGLVLVTVINDKFIDYFDVFFHSLKKHNPWLNCPLIVIWSKTLSPIDDESRSRIAAVWDKVIYHEVDETRYQVFLGQTPEHMLPALFSLECFNMPEWERVVFFDVDMLCMGDVSELFTKEVTVGICPSGPDRKRKQCLANGWHINVGINTGVMVLGRTYRRSDVYDAFFSLKSGSVADQDIIDSYFKWKPVYCFDHKYNYHAAFFWDQWGMQDDIRILHYAGAKPLQLPKLPRMAPWFGYLRERREVTDISARKSDIDCADDNALTIRKLSVD